MKYIFILIRFVIFMIFYIGIIVLEFGLGSIIQEKTREIVSFLAFDSTTLQFYINNPSAPPRDY